MLNDFRVGLRLLIKDRAFALASLLTLAVCIAANVALFAVVDQVVLRPLPWPGADRILLMANQYPGAGVSDTQSSSVPDYFDRQRETTVFESQAMSRRDQLTVDLNGSPSRIPAMSVTPSFFGVVGVSPALGRTFTEGEGEIGSEHRVILSYGLWQSAFGGDPHVVGRDLRVNEEPYTIVGVMPPSFTMGESRDDTRMWRPLAFTPEQKSDDSRHSNSHQHIGKLKPGATIDQARQQIDALNARNLEKFPEFRDILTNARFHTTVVKLQDDLIRDLKPTLYLLWAGALFVLLLGTVNVANLVLVRTAGRLRELVTRMALGASRWRIVRQLVTENLLLTTISSAAGLFLGMAALQLITAFNLLNLPHVRDIRIDAATMALTLASAITIAVLLALIPVAHLFRVELAAVLMEQGRASTGGRGTRIVRQAFVIAQIAFAFVLLVGAGLLLASFRRVLAVDPGFLIDHVQTSSVALPQTRYKDDPARVAFTNEALRRLRALPGVSAAGATDTIPFGGRNTTSVIFAEGYQMHRGESLIAPNRVTVSPGYFEAIGATLADGRFFDARDAAAAPKTIIVDEKLARHFWPSQNPLGRRMYFPTNVKNLTEISDKTEFMTVVGVVHDLKLADLVGGNGAVGAYFMPSDQRPLRAMTLAVRTAGEPLAITSAIRGAVNGLDPALPLFDVYTMRERMDESLATRRASMLLALVFSGVALLLSAIGVYGVLAYLVAQRTKEFGIRLALGSSTSAVFRLVLREGLALVAAGFLAGAGGVLVLRRSIDSLLFGITPVDPTVLAAVAMTLALAAAAAGSFPARRATRIPPTVALAE